MACIYKNNEWIPIICFINKWLVFIKKEWMNIYSSLIWMAGIYKKKGWIPIVCLINK